jgi:(1->4)-alpha-D-glucan 1-alpha-D-glucosylmutase
MRMQPLALHAAGLVDGLRVDHVDGLADPRAYCRRLHARLAAQRDERPFLVVEKILAPGETLPDDWHADGTTGYDFMNDVAALLHDRPAPSRSPALGRRVGRRAPSPTRRSPVAAAPRQLAGEHARLARALHRIARAAPATRDISRNALHRVLGELAVHLPVYRMYPALGDEPGDADRRVLERAYDAARAATDPSDRCARARRRLARAARHPRAARRSGRALRVAFAQLSAPLAAKGVEDTANYRYGRLLSRNEVGADAGDFSLSRGAFHARNRRRARSVPRTLVATATHDHKRGEDARARLAVLSEVPDAWRAVSLDWSALNQPHRGAAHRDLAWTPGPAAEAMLYQTLVGCWPPTLAPDDAAGVAALAERGGLANEGAARGEAAHRLARARCGLRTRERAVRPRDPHAARCGRFSASAACVVARIARPASSTVSRRWRCASRRRACPICIKVPSYGSLSGRSRQPARGARAARGRAGRSAGRRVSARLAGRAREARADRDARRCAHRRRRSRTARTCRCACAAARRHAVASRRDDTATVVVVRLACRLLGDMPALRASSLEWGDTAVAAAGGGRAVARLPERRRRGRDA